MFNCMWVRFNLSCLKSDQQPKNIFKTCFATFEVGTILVTFLENHENIGSLRYDISMVMCF